MTRDFRILVPSVLGQSLDGLNEGLLRLLVVAGQVGVILVVVFGAGYLLVRDRARERRRRAYSFCRVCDYDLRETPDHCPECGTVPLVRRAKRTSTPTSSDPDRKL